MNEQETRTKISFLEKRALLKKLNKKECLTEDEQKQLLTGITYKELVKYSKQICHFSSDALKILLEPEYDDLFQTASKLSFWLGINASQALQEYGSKKHVHVLMKEHMYDLSLCPYAWSKLLIIVFGKEPDASLFQGIGNLPKDVFQTFAEKGQLDVIVAYILASNGNSIGEAAEELLIRNNFGTDIVKQKLVKQKYLQEYELFKPAIMFFAENGTEKEVITMIDRLNSRSYDDDIIEMLLQQNNQRILERLIKEHLHFSVENETLLLKFASDELMKLYLKENQLYLETERQLVLSDRDELLSWYLENCGEPDTSNSELLFSSSNEKAKITHEKTFGLSYRLERDFIRNGKEEEILLYTEKHPLSPMNEVLLVETGTEQLLHKYLEQSTVTQTCCVTDIALARRQDIPSVLELLLQQCIHNDVCLTADAFRHLVKNPAIADKQVMTDYIQTFAKEFDAALITTLFSTQNLKLIKLFIETVGKWAEGTVQRFLENAPTEALLIYIDNYNLSETDESILVSRKDDAVLKAYFEKTEFYEDAEALFIKTASDELISAYIEKYSLGVSAIDNLIDCEKYEILKQYVELHPLSDDEATRIFSKTWL